ncbi:MAG TPA: DEAD/DEAH box helicase [Solirubrobacterales bacterium]
MTFEAEPILRGLKSFQRNTVEYVFERFFSKDDPVDRFLVADEVGLGKTMVARGVIAKLIERHLQEDGRRIDVVYICSNQAIAQQNFSKLSVVGRERRPVTDRITTLPLNIGGLNEKLSEYGRGINIIPVTPTTSLDLRSSGGRADERALLWWLLTDERLIGSRQMRRKGGRRLFMPPIKNEVSFAERLDQICGDDIDEDLWSKFVAAVRGSEMLDEVGELIETFRSEPRLWMEPWRDRRIQVVAGLRRTLADSCVRALEPDLVILDEFQRFPKLFEQGSDTGELARKLFDYEGCKSLLLSATPYRMFSRAHELDDDHHRDFLSTTSFLIDDADRSAELKELMSTYRGMLKACAGGDDGAVEAEAARDAVRGELMRVMCRTERLGAAGDRNGMLDARPAHALEPRLQATDLRGYADLERVASRLHARDVVEFWKSAPYALNLMDDYMLSRSFEEEAKSATPVPVATRIDAEAVRSYGDVDPGNARLRGLIQRLEEERAWQCLWLPPSLPYYAPGRPFDRATVATKRLIFSNWKVVPKAIAALTSFQMDRQIYKGLPGDRIPNSADGRRSLGQPLQWRKDGRLTELLLAAPGVGLAQLTDPLKLAAGLASGSAGLSGRSSLLIAAERNVRAALRKLELPAGTGAADPLWYLVAMLRLDALAPGWLRADAFGAEDEHLAWSHHVALLRGALEGEVELGAVPKDLARVLAHVGVGAPGTCALRALRRSGTDVDRDEVEQAALRIGNAMRLQLNLPESVAIVRASGRAPTRIRAGGDGAYWRGALDYCINGNLQAVLDEYVHVLRDWVGGTSESSRLDAVAKTATEAIGIDAPSLRGRNITAEGRIDETDSLAFHSRLAVRLDRGQGEDEQSVQRVDTVRKAFNSPFWPFVVATTSIGQEGLDFHLYSHAVVHWNLPRNPVDLEQREGRVHRFKNHAVRRNLAAALRSSGIDAAPADPWAAMFEAAEEDVGGLVPYWVFPGDARIERHVPAEPMSIDRQLLEELVGLTGIYRLAFGQPRQDELVAALRGLGAEPELAKRLVIDLAPPAMPGA